MNEELTPLTALKALAENHHITMQKRGIWHRYEFSECLADTCKNSRKVIAELVTELDRLHHIAAAAKKVVNGWSEYGENFVIGPALVDGILELAAALNS